MNSYEVLEYANKNNKYEKIRSVVTSGWAGGTFREGNKGTL